MVPHINLYVSPILNLSTSDLPCGGTRGLQGTWCFVMSALGRKSVFLQEEEEERVEEEA